VLTLAACSGDTPDLSQGGAAPVRATLDSPAPAGTPLDGFLAGAQDAYAAGQFDRAVARYEALYQQATYQQDVPMQARALTWAGLAHWKLGNHQDSRRVGEAALALKRRHGLEDQYWRSYNALGLLAWLESRLSDAQAYYADALEVARATGDRTAEAKSLMNLALVQTELGQFAEARAAFVAQQAVLAELDSTRLEGMAYNNLGMLEIRVGNPQGAIPLLHRAIDLYQAVGYNTGIQNALGQLGTAYTALGDAHRAFMMLDSALVLAAAQGLDQEQASDLEALAELHRGAGDFRRALAVYDSAKRINARLGLDLETGMDLRGEADIYVTLGDLARALQAAHQALNIHRAVGAPMEVVFDLLTLAEIQDGLDDSAAAVSGLAEARTLADALGARIARVAVGLTEARLADRHRDAQAVLASLERIRPDVSRGGYGAEWEAYLLESKALARVGRNREAIQAGRRALRTVERVRGTFGSGMLRTAFVADKADVYAHLIAILLRDGQVEEAFAVADAARGRALLERLSASRPSGEPVNEPLAQGETLLREIDQLVESIDYTEQEFPPDIRTDDHQDELGRLYERLSQLRLEYEGLLVHAAETDQPRAALLGAAAIDVQAVQAALEPRELLVEYFVPPEATGVVMVFAVSRRHIHVLETPIATRNVASRVRVTRDLIARKGASGQLATVLSGLHTALIQPLLATGLVRDVDDLIVVPHRALGYLPWAALIDSTTNRYLVQDFTIRIVPSAAALPVLSQARRTGAAGVAAFAPFPQRLPGSRLEIKAVRGPGPVTRFYGRQASERSVRHALAETSVVHVASHGILNASNPMFSRLELARDHGADPSDDGRLEVHEVLGLRIGSDLVFLSGCETGIGSAQATVFLPGEDYTTLGQAFLHAGAGSVIATLWPVWDASGAAFAGEFYRALDGQGAAHALARAQRAMLAERASAHPIHWAAYQLIGADVRGYPHVEARASVPRDTQLFYRFLQVSQEVS
jgi:CHAT domain-containing protein